MHWALTVIISSLTASLIIVTYFFPNALSAFLAMAIISILTSFACRTPWENIHSLFQDCSAEMAWDCLKVIILTILILLTSCEIAMKYDPQILKVDHELSIV